ncbi:MAG: aminoglycoside phosphotransferase family protein [Chloroflexota bacterium]
MTDLNNVEYIASLTNDAVPLDAHDAIVVTDIEQVHQGMDDTVVYNTTWPEDVSVPLTLQLYRGRITYWQVEDDHKAEREWAVLRRLRFDPFPVPRPLAQGEIQNQPYIIWRTPIGQAWSMGKDKRIDQMKQVIPQMASFLVQLHSLNHKGLNNEPLYQATVAGTLVRMLLWSRQMGNEDLRAVIARLKPAVAQLKSWRPSLLHGDLNIDKVVTRHGEILAFTGWEQAAIGDPRWDVMTTAHSLRSLDVNLAEQFVNWYETFSGKTIEDRAFWWAMISVRLWAIKAWAHYAIDAKVIDTNLNNWAKDVDVIRVQAFADLESARL